MLPLQPGDIFFCGPLSGCKSRLLSQETSYLNGLHLPTILQLRERAPSARGSCAQRQTPGACRGYELQRALEWRSVALVGMQRGGPSPPIAARPLIARPRSACPANDESYMRRLDARRWYTICVATAKPTCDPGGQSEAGGRGPLRLAGTPKTGAGGFE